LLPSASDTESALLQRVERIETRLDISIPAGEAAMSAAVKTADRQGSEKQYARKIPAPVPEVTTATPAQAESAPPPPPMPTAKPEPKPKPEPEPAPRPRAEPEPEAAPTPAAAAGPAELSATSVRSMWPTIREKVRERSRSTEALLAGAVVRAVAEDTLTLAHESAPLAKRLSEQRNIDVIRDALKDALGVDWRVRCEFGVGEPAGDAALPSAAGAGAADTQRAEEDDMIAEVGTADDASPRRDPEEVALELLQSELGARRIDG